ncbi:NAD synthetase [Prochlorococcus phage P-TIM68]|uniref:Putative NAD+ synthetase n=1 Tax=Prochlorococcus phage P-TIM68 TaxID=1542477 RepID=A0A0K0KVL1_9CAUD|nr:NAD synthetase [Prochlorococcus phage P-TIM68]AIR93516.1 putative NAD+ synthetase [Prochlorococcus phage P-TIM68]
MNRITDYPKLKTDIKNWMTDYIKSSGMNCFVVGVSGGIDSAVASALAAETEYPIFALGMPIHQKEEQETLSDAHLKWLSDNYDNVESHKVDLTNTFDTFKHDLERYATDNHALANTRSRLRMVTLYQFAGQYKGIVVGTGNKVEDYGVGFYTKYGDGGVDIAPIADLYKSEVWNLGKVLGVDSRIIEAKPTDGLWDDGRTDEDQLGATYSELEEAMETGQGSGLKVLEKYARMNSHKMNPIPTFKL